MINMIKITYKSDRDMHEYMQGVAENGSDIAVTLLPEHENAVSFSVYDAEQGGDASVTLDKETALSIARYIVDSIG